MNVCWYCGLEFDPDDEDGCVARGEGGITLGHTTEHQPAAPRVDVAPHC